MKKALIQRQRGRASAAWAAGSRWLVVAALGIAVAVGVVVGIFVLRDRENRAQAGVSRLRLGDIPFNGDRAYGYLKQLCDLGPRASGSKGMEAQQKLLAEHFARLGGTVHWQRFQTRHPLDNSPVNLANLIVEWHPERKERVLLCAHYDTLPFPMLDPRYPRGVFVGANDNASGVAILMELAQEMAALKPRLGVDFVLFDAEEFLFHRDGKYFLGSEHFARQYVEQRPPHRYRAAVLLDMVGDADLQIYMEGHSMSWADSQPLVEEIWGAARRLRVREFIPRVKHHVLDDHIALHEIAQIPACDIIDFDYPAWHTQADRADRCSALSLAKVGWVLREWLVTTGLGGGEPRGGN